MKIAGKSIPKPVPEILVIPRPETEEPILDEKNQPIIENGLPVTRYINNDVVFRAQAVLDYGEFEKLLPIPTPPKILRRGESQQTEDSNDPKYRALLMRRAGQQTQWMILKSLEATEGLQWETVDMQKPDTWENWITELRDAGFTNIDCNRIVELVTTANSLNEARYNEAKRAFLAGQGKQK